MKEYIGVDLGKRKAVEVKKDRWGKVTGRATLAVTQAALENYFSKQDRKSAVVVEATGNSVCTSTRQSRSTSLMWCWHIH